MVLDSEMATVEVTNGNIVRVVHTNSLAKYEAAGFALVAKKSKSKKTKEESAEEN